MAVTSFLRTVVADTPYSSFFALSFGYLLVSGSILTTVKCMKKQDFRMAWYTKTANNEWRFSKAQFLMVWLGGMAELGTSLFSILAFNQADKNHVNAGLAGVLFPLSSTFVAIAAYFMYGERLNWVQGAGILIVMAGATLIAAFPAKTDSEQSAMPK